MENVIISVVNLISLILGGSGIVLVYKLARRYNIAFLNSYLLFMICAVLTGFCDWVIFNLVLMLVPGISLDTADFIYHIFWDLLGFPAYLFAFYYLTRTVDYLLKRRFRNLQNKIFLAILIAIIVLDYIGFYFRLQGGVFIFSRPLWFLYTLILPLTILLYLVFAYLWSARDSMKKHSGPSRFILILLSGFLLWTILSLAPLRDGTGRHLIILAYYLALFAPVLYIQLRQKDFMISRQFNEGMNLSTILKNYKFTAREVQLTTLIIEGKSNQEISELLFVSTQTVKNYIYKMYKKVGVKNRIQFVNLLRDQPL